MPRFSLKLILLMGLLISLQGCGGCGDGRKPTYPVRGVILVDGKPAHEAFIWFHPTDTIDPRRVCPFAQADEQGKFQLNSYVTGDGAPTGEFIVTFEWPHRSGFMNTKFDGPDRLKGKYKDLHKSQLKVNIDKQGKDLGTFELTTN